jgi:hypothetical protein
MAPKYHESVRKAVEDPPHASVRVVAPWARTGPFFFSYFRQCEMQLLGIFSSSCRLFTLQIRRAQLLTHENSTNGVVSFPN